MPFSEPTTEPFEPLPAPPASSSEDRIFRKLTDILDEARNISIYKQSDYLAENLSGYTAEELTVKNGLLLEYAVKNNDAKAVEFLARKAQWPAESYQNTALYAAKQGEGRLLGAVLSIAHPQKSALLHQLNDNFDSYDGQVQGEIKKAKDSHLGAGWKIIGQGEISKTVRTYTAALERVFNFNAMNVTTIATQDKAVSVTERNFRDCQDDADIQEAYEKLCVFEKNPPVYKGKDTGVEPRRIARRNTIQGAPS
ncbi:MAG: hypothetical protein EA357_09530 [Micavibrio sp.]|nr:MAG: hypothetical protein EA357_09530 [Micavibrio sp.]